MKKGRLLAEPPIPSPVNPKGLLKLDSPAGRFDLRLDLVGFGFVDAFLDRLGGAFDQRLGFGQAEPGEGGLP